MNARFLKYLPIILIGALLAAFYPYPHQQNVNQHKKEVLAHTILGSLSNYHYAPKNVDDDFSEDVFNTYLERLDYNKRFLLKKDVKELEKYKDDLDDQLIRGDYTFFNLANKIIEQRVTEAQGYYRAILAQPFELEKSGKIELDPKKTDWASNTKKLEKRWEESLKHQTLNKILDLEKEREEAIKNSDTAAIAKMTDAELEAEARKKILKSHDDWFHRMEKIDERDRLSSYWNSVTMVYDPHTNFYPPKDKENFDIAMSGRLEGIGATLQEKDGLIKVTRIVPGSASWRQGQLKSGDIILKVAQGRDEPVSIVDMRLDDAVKLIRGPKGSEVRLTVKKLDGTTIVIPIIRDVVILEETYAKSAVAVDKETGQRVGYIKLPKFYADFTRSGGRSCANDVKLEIEKLKKENISGIILDLRDNGGGSLADVVEMAGLFIEQGPIVQVNGGKNAGGIRTHPDTDPRVQYDGKLVILVNQFSASASEIMAAAMQDYKRAVIIGSPTYGKGTVQRFIDLDQLLQGENQVKPLGAMKLTIQKFYRINGGATQKKGVTPDIILPDEYTYVEMGEKEMDYVMPWDEIAPALYDETDKVDDLDELREKSNARTSTDSTFIKIEANAKRLKQVQDKTEYSLKLSEYKMTKEKEKEEADKYQNVYQEIPNLEIQTLEIDLPTIESDTTKQTLNEEWHKELRKDPYLKEAMEVIRDIDS